MKLKVAIVDKDVNYMNRLQKNFQLKYADKINILKLPTLKMGFAP